MAQLHAYVCGKHGPSEHEFESHVADQLALSARLEEVYEAAGLAEARLYGAAPTSHDDATAA